MHEFWKICWIHGIVIVVFIAKRLSKLGKSFAFVRFIKVDNVEMLV